MMVLSRIAEISAEMGSNNENGGLSGWMVDVMENRE